MAGFLVKLIICPLTVLAADILFPQVYYPSVFQAILVGVILAVGAYAMEVLLLKRGTFWISTAVDFIAATLIVFVVSLLLPGARVTLLGAIMTALLLSITEYVQHLWLIESGRTKKSDQRI